MYGHIPAGIWKTNTNMHLDFLPDIINKSSETVNFQIY